MLKRGQRAERTRDAPIDRSRLCIEQDETAVRSSARSIHSIEGIGFDRALALAVVTTRFFSTSLLVVRIVAVGSLVRLAFRDDSSPPPPKARTGSRALAMRIFVLSHRLLRVLQMRRWFPRCVFVVEFLPLDLVLDRATLEDALTHDSLDLVLLGSLRRRLGLGLPRVALVDPVEALGDPAARHGALRALLGALELGHDLLQGVRLRRLLGQPLRGRLEEGARRSWFFLAWSRGFSRAQESRSARVPRSRHARVPCSRGARGAGGAPRADCRSWRLRFGG